MTFRKNVKREKILLDLWLQGKTVKTASILTNIPEGSISHYYARFNRDKKKYSKSSETGFNEPPRSSPADVAKASLSLNSVIKTVLQLAKEENYAKARDYLQMLLLFSDLEKRYSAIINNRNPDKTDEIFMHILKLV